MSTQQTNKTGPGGLITLAVAIGLIWIGFTAIESYSKRKTESSQVRKIHISIAQAKDKWPFFGVTEGDVKCIDGYYIVFETSEGTYAVNGSAKTKSRADGEGWLPIEDITLPGKDIGPILKGGNQLCNQ